MDEPLDAFSLNVWMSLPVFKSLSLMVGFQTPMMNCVWSELIAIANRLQLHI
ncbi:MAG: hypothetical protein MUD14_12800 [Hydrococcus sp. Prado102]|nr:hypothetical protein [Hydrococcus sp. Prado102]